MKLQLFKFGEDYKRFLQLLPVLVAELGFGASALSAVLSVAAFVSVWTFLARCDEAGPAFGACFSL